MPSLMATLGLNWSGFRAGTEAAVRTAQTAGNRIGTALGGAVTSRLAGYASVAGIGMMARHVVEYAHRMDILSERLGISAEALQAWDYALRQSGSSVESAAGFLERLAGARQKALAGNADAIASFKKLGVSLDDLKGKRLEDLGLQISQAFASGDPQALIASLREVGGRGAGELVAAFRSGFPELVKAARDAGTIMSEETVAALSDAADTSERLWMRFMAGMAPALAKGAELLKGLWRGLESGMTAVVGLVKVGPKAADEMVKELEAGWAEADKLEKDRREKRRQARAGGLGEEGESAAAKKAANERLRLEERLAEIRSKNYLDSLSKEEQITELNRRRAELARWVLANWGRLSEEGRLKAQIDLEEMGGRAAELGRGKAGAAAKLNYARTSAQQVGAWGAADTTATASLDTQRKSERHLDGIRQDIRRLTDRRTTGGVEF